MTMERFQMDKDDEGVSEVLGTILTLIITVLLFSSVFIGVQNLETPDERNYTKFELSYEISTLEVGNPSYAYFINVTNSGGTPLRSEYTQIIITSDNLETGESSHFRFDHEDDEGDDLEDGNWKLGETFHVYADNTTNEEFYDELNDTDTQISLMVVDRSRSQVVWDEIVKKPGEIGPIIRRRGVDYKQSWLNSADPGDNVTLYVYIVDKYSREIPDVSVDLSELEGYTGLKEMGLSGYYKPYKENRFELTITIDENQENGTFLLGINAENEEFTTESQYIVLNVGERPISDEAELIVDPDRITTTSNTPVSEDSIVVTSTIYNAGGGSTEANIVFYDRLPNGTEIEVGNTTERFPAGGGRDVRMSWTIKGAGTHRVTVEATDVSNGVGDTGSRNLTVYPRILLVDDDPSFNSTPEPNVMRNTLDALNIEYGSYVVGTGDGPDYEDELEKYDLVIWMTGEETDNTLTEVDRQNLEMFLNDGNKLWLIGNGILGDTNVPKNWIRENLYSDETGDHRELESPLRGRSPPTSENDTYVLHEDPGATEFITPINNGEEMLIDRDGDGDTVAVSHEGENGERTIFQHMLFGSIQESTTADRTKLTSQVIQWLGNVTHREGTDLALTNQEYDNPNPNFMETVTVTGVIRNNGPEPLSTDVTLEVDGRVYDEIHVLEEELPPGGTTNVEFEWLADEVGIHELLIVVDPYDRIDETSTTNNDIRYQDGDTTVDVNFTTLIVDDEDDEGENGRGITTDGIVDIYDQLDLVYEVYKVEQGNEGPTTDDMMMYNTVTWVTGVKDQDTLTESNIENITSYHEDHSSGFFLIGDGVLRDLVNNDHDEFIRDVLKIDPDTVINHDDGPEIIHGIFGHTISHGTISSLNTNFKPSSYSILEGDPVFEDSGGDIFAHSHYDSQYDSNVVHMGIALEHFKEPHDDPSYDESHWYEEHDMNTSAEAVRGELMYLTNTWMGMVDQRIELRVTHEDIFISDENPIIGHASEITALVHNLGGTGTEALVRFKDGDSHIASKSLYVPAYSTADVEVKWEPIHAGEARPIRVIVDPLNEVAEIPNKPGEHENESLYSFNNQAIEYTPVYYFWDDMESGGDLWTHDAKLAHISGETEPPLDFMSSDYEDVNTDVIDDWDWSMSEGVQNVSFDSHSYPDSYFMQEPVGRIGRRADVFVAIAIDGSDSMRDRDNTTGVSYEKAALEGARTLVNSLSNESIVMLVGYEGTNAVVKLEPTKLADGRDLVNTAIDDWDSQGGQTPLWDSIGLGYEQIVYDYSDMEPDLQRAVVKLTDGADYGASDRGVNWQRVEEGSNTYYWSPWHEMYDENGNENWVNHGERRGKYTLPWGTEAGEWRTLNIGNERRGLLQETRDSPVPIFTIGLGLEHYEDIPNWDAVTTTDWNEEYQDPDYHVYEHEDYPEAGTVEYNLWRIANTSGAEYFYSPGGDELEDIFETIGEYLSGPQNLTSVDPTPTSTDENSLTSFPHAEEDNEHKYAVTPSLNVQNMSEAWLTFWHKYRIIQGVNGAYLEIGHFNESDEWHWDYVQPAVGPYTGNLLIQEEVYDDSGREIEWAWTGKNGQNTMHWEYVRLNVMNYLDRLEIDDEYRDNIRIRFKYHQFGGATVPGGWFIDDVSITASRIGDDDSHIHDGMQDMWQLNETMDRYGKNTTAWWSGEPGENEFRGGIDNSLMTTSIDLRNADTAVLNADFKFNINTESGVPPDVVRVEITTDGGRSWESINLGKRVATGVSGDGGTNYWVNAGDLSRLNVDLSDYSGNTIRMRFRVATNNGENYDNFEDGTVDFGGFYVNNVVISGRTVGS